MTPEHTRARWRRPDRGRRLADLVSDPVVVAPDDTCESVDLGFRTAWTGSSVLVAPRTPGAGHGLVARKDFLTTMTGRYGFGRSLWARRPVADVTRWDVPRVAVTASLTEAAEALAEGDAYCDMVVTDPAGSPVGVLDPTTLMAALADELAHQASHDHLTGVTSRAGFVEELDRMCAAARAGRGAVALAFLDLDRLKEVNDTLGHGTGDALLASVARRLVAATRRGDVVGRLGGDEFAVARALDPQTPDDPWRTRADALGERLRAAVAAPDPDLPAAAHSRASVGVAVGAGALLDHDRLLREADLAMYGAKKAGGDRVRSAAAGTDGAVARGAASDAGAPGGAAPHGAAPDAAAGHTAAGPAPAPPAPEPGGVLEVHYQPILPALGAAPDAPGGEVEALLRWRDAAGGLHGPARPLADAARAGRAADLDLWVLERACADLAAWTRDLGPAAPAVTNVNLAPASLEVPDLADRVLTVLARCGVEPARVRLELSEAATSAQVAGAAPALHRLRSHGVRVALDDLGSALATLRHVGRVPVDVLKIDREVVAGMLTDDVDRLLVDLCGRVAAAAGLTVVAEGVERPEQLAALQDAGVGMVQGFLLARPMPEAELRARLLTPAV